MEKTKKRNIPIKPTTNRGTIKRRHPSFPMRKINHILSKESAEEILQMIKTFFEKEVLSKIEDCPRPIVKKHGDFVERKRGRFEITPPPALEKKIWKQLLKNETFVKINQETKDFITSHHNRCIEELCILPVEPGTKSGSWHRDIFVDSQKDFAKDPFYITQIIYLDDKANTEFCIDSQNHSNNNPQLYTKKRVKAEPLSSILFDGRTLHKGLENNAQQTRYAIYVAYYDSSYVDKESIKDKILHKDKLC
jgi:hypothetical protein